MIFLFKEVIFSGSIDSFVFGGDFTFQSRGDFSLFFSNDFCYFRFAFALNGSRGGREEEWKCLQLCAGQRATPRIVVSNDSFEIEVRLLRLQIWSNYSDLTRPHLKR